MKRGRVRKEREEEMEERKWGVLRHYVQEVLQL